MKVIKILFKILLSLIILLCILIGAAFIYHKICNKNYEDKYYKQESYSTYIDLFENKYVDHYDIGGERRIWRKIRY